MIDRDGKPIELGAHYWWDEGRDQILVIAEAIVGEFVRIGFDDPAIAFTLIARGDELQLASE